MDTVKDNVSWDSFVFLKGQKLSAALHLITSQFNDAEPVKYRLRDKALEVLALIDKRHFELATRLIDQLISLIDIVLLAQLGSEMNFSVLKKEYQNLRGRLLDARHATFTLSQSLVMPEPIPPTKSIPPPTPLSQTSAVPTVKIASPNRHNNESRQQVILALIKAKGWLSIKDIASALPEFSTKTVQRELVALVSRGLLRREGDRRWSRYNLI